MHSYWQKQTLENPLYPDMEWERPERRDQAGTLLIIGGSSHSFHAVAEAYAIAVEQGIGEARIIVPEPLRKLTKHIPNMVYGPATPAGSFSAKAIEPMIFAAAACDGALLIGDLDRNSETTIAISQFIRTYNGPLTITRDAFDNNKQESKFIASRPNTLLVLAPGQLQLFAREVGSEYAFTSSMDLLVFVERLHQFTNKYPETTIITRHADLIVLSKNGTIITTAYPEVSDLWRTKASSLSAVAWLHHRDKMLEGIASSLVRLFD
jgi:NAD(P)H-hydrate repair Nnr-like enzyme with NAD(P)H-hydrate dehydratase domain